MLIGKSSSIPSSEITPEQVYLNRRSFLGKAAGIALAAGTVPAALAGRARSGTQEAAFQDMRSELDEKLTPYDDVTTYNNFYEFGTGKRDPARTSADFQPRPWSIQVDGHVSNPGTYHLEDFLAPHKVEDRVYRLRCVEAWSMVIPWRGVPLADMIRRFEPTSTARFVQFVTLLDRDQFPGQRRRVLDWPYVEGLRLDEAMNPLTMMVTGVYGRDLPNQNGAPLRLIVPWKYGFKGIKSIVRMSFVENMPRTTWALSAPNEYGFYANVNPEVDHPRWSQARERRIGQLRRRRTLMFNGYGEQVAHLYSGMDLARNY